MVLRENQNAMWKNHLYLNTSSNHHAYRSLQLSKFAKDINICGPQWRTGGKLSTGFTPGGTHRASDIIRHFLKNLNLRQRNRNLYIGEAAFDQLRILDNNVLFYQDFKKSRIFRKKKKHMIFWATRRSLTFWISKLTWSFNLGKSNFNFGINLVTGMHIQISGCTKS